MLSITFPSVLRRIWAFSDDISYEGQQDLDRALADRLVEGDPDAVATLVEQYADDLYRFVYNQVGGSEQDTEDIVQDTFIAALKAIRRFRGDSKLRTWLFSIAVHKAMDRKRYLARRPQIPLQDVTFSLPASEDKPEQLLERFEMRQAVRQALLQLPHHYRAALVLKYVEEMTVKEIAQIMDRSVKSVESILVRARRRLAEIFEGRYGAP